MWGFLSSALETFSEILLEGGNQVISTQPLLHVDGIGALASEKGSKDSPWSQIIA